MSGNGWDNPPDQRMGQVYGSEPEVGVSFPLAICDQMAKHCVPLAAPSKVKSTAKGDSPFLHIKAQGVSDVFVCVREDWAPEDENLQFSRNIAYILSFCQPQAATKQKPPHTKSYTEKNGSQCHSHFYI